jgi:hypothetical protein
MIAPNPNLEESVSKVKAMPKFGKPKHELLSVDQIKLPFFNRSCKG